MNETVKDPVCHMDVPATSFPVEYEGIHFAFCSAQCKERFQANPHLYIGSPGRKAAAQQGKQIIKQRRMVLSAPLDSGQADVVKRALREMMGIIDICIEDKEIDIRYDLIQVTVGQIADRLASVGSELGSGWMERLKLAFINYQEECEIGNLEVDSGKRCH
ncbi:MAG: YHS domain-containing protein [Nitrosomonadales bacterium]|nr:YHS domain-containing protein [Nitrosomonadales bacterium]